MKPLNLCLVLILGLGLAAATRAGELPPPFVADYTIKMGFLKLGKAQRRFEQRADGSLTYISISKSAGMLSWLVKEDLTETSRLEWFDERVRPLEYRKDRKGKKRQQISQRFDWRKKKVFSQVNDESYEFELPDGGLDQSMYQLSLMVDLSNGQRNMDYPIAGNDKFRSYPIRFMREETIDTLYGPLNTVVIERQDKKVKTIMWCAPRLHYLPVRITHQEKGNQFTAELKGLSGMALLDQ